MWAVWLSGLVVVFVLCVVFLIFAPSKTVFYPHKDYYNISDICGGAFKDNIMKNVTEWDDDSDMCRAEGMEYHTIKLYDGEWKTPFESRIDLRGVKSITLAKLGARSILKPFKQETEHMQIMTPISVPSENINKCGVWVDGDFRPLDTTVMFDPTRIMSVFNSRKLPATYLIIHMKRPKKIK